MIAKTLALFALVAAAQAGNLYGGAYFDTHVGAQSEQNIRGLGYNGVSTLSTQSKAVDSAYSSVRRHETRVHNPAVVNAAYATYAAPAVSYAAAAPVQYTAAAPAYAYSAGPAVARVAAAPAYAYSAAPAVSYAAAPAIARYAAAPAIARVAAPVAAHGLLGVAYSAVPEVAHLNFDGFGVHYGY